MIDTRKLNIECIAVGIPKLPEPDVLCIKPTLLINTAKSAIIRVGPLRPKES